MGLNLNTLWNGATKTRPSIPVLGTLIVVSDTEITVPYTSSYPVEIWYSTTELGTYTKHGDSSSTPYEATGLTQGTLYYFKARAKNGSKYSAFGSAASEYTTGSMTFTSVQPATVQQISFKYKITTGKSISINWGYNPSVLLTADGTEKTIISVFPNANTTYTITITGDICYLLEFYIRFNQTVQINSNQISKLKQLDYLYIYSAGGVYGETINSSDLIGLPLTKLYLNDINTFSSFNTVHLSNMNLTELHIITHPSLTSVTFRSDDLKLMQLNYLLLSSNAGNHYINTVDLTNCPLTFLNFTGYGSTSNIRSIDLVGKQLTSLTIHGGYTNCEIDSSDFVGMPLSVFDMGHMDGTVIDSSDFVDMSLTNFTLYGNGQTYNINLSDFSGMTTLTTFYINGGVSPVAITSGKLSDLPTGLTTLFTYSVTGLDIIAGTMKSWANTTITLSNNHDSSNVDSFLIAWALVAGAGVKTITIKKARTSASDTAVATLNGLGKTINTSN